MTDGKRVKTLEPQAFDVELYSSHEPLLVAFLKRNARFSGQSKVLDDTSREYRDRVNCYLYDADYLDTAMERFKVEGTPTFLLFSDGREVDRLMGESDRDSLDDFIRAVIPPKS